MRLTEQYIVDHRSDIFLPLMDLCHRAKNLYNTAMYTVRQYYFTATSEGLPYTYLNWYGVDSILKRCKNADYYSLPINASQNVLKRVHEQWLSYFSLLKKKRTGGYDKKVSLPKYLPSEGHFVFEIDSYKLGVR